ncbi:MAG: T9SS C-terminal target domain-containing protein [Bacteroidetes bacterium]|nr:MAG: T9SS C-terminal target domain-containing protein [Bacteroidota bacterium]
MKKLYFLLLTVLMTATSFGQVFITEIADPNNNAEARFIELYNAGPTDVDFTEGNGWQIDKYTNASGTVSTTLDLTGTIPAGGFYVIGYDNTPGTFNTVYGFAADQLDAVNNGVVGSNGDDDLALVDGTDTIIDFFGVPATDNTGTCAEYEDGRAERSPAVTMGNATFDESEWNVWADSAVSGCTNHTLQTQDAPASFDPGSWIGTATGPVVTIDSDITGLDYFEGNGPSAEQTFSVSGINLTGNLDVTAPTNFEISSTSGSGFGSSVSLTPSAGSVASTTLYVRLVSGLSANTYSDVLTASSTGATSETINVSGEVSPSTPQFNVLGTPGDMNYGLGNGPSNEESIFVEGLFLTNDITVTAPTNFEVSLTSGTGFGASVTVPQVSGTVANTEVFVRLASGLTEGAYSGNITVSSSPAADQTVALTGNVFGAATNALVLVGVYDGPLTGGTPKGIELIALADIPDLSVFGISSITNGAGSSAGTVEYNFPADAVSAGDRIFLATESTGFNSFFGMMPTYTSGVVGINGDDAIELYEGTTIIDTFGDVDMDGTGEAWDYLDGWAYRVNGTGPDGGFVLANWTFSGADALDGETDNSTAATPYPIATYTNPALSNATFTQANFSIYPNPTNKGYVNIKTTSNSAVNVTVFDLLGKKVITKTLSNNKLNVSSLKSGVYLLNIEQNGASTTKKLVIE